MSVPQSEEERTTRSFNHLHKVQENKSVKIFKTKHMEYGYLSSVFAIF